MRGKGTCTREQIWAALTAMHQVRLNIRKCGPALWPFARVVPLSWWTSTGKWKVCMRIRNVTPLLWGVPRPCCAMAVAKFNDDGEGALVQTCAIESHSRFSGALRLTSSWHSSRGGAAILPAPAASTGRLRSGPVKGILMHEHVSDPACTSLVLRGASWRGAGCFSQHSGFFTSPA